MTLEKFWNNIRKADANQCWVWRGGKDSNGYGILRFNGKTMRPHRLMWMLKNGKIPKGLGVLHKCDNRPCCNPSHLFLGTQAENVADAASKNRMDHVGQHKLSLHQISAMKKLLDQGLSQREIAIKFELHQSTVSRIKHQKRKKYKCL